MDSLLPIAAQLDQIGNKYTRTVLKMREKINDASQTLSGYLLDKLTQNNMSFIELGSEIGIANKSYYQKLNQSKNIHWHLFENEAKESELRQEELEKSVIEPVESFEDFVENYFNN